MAWFYSFKNALIRTRAGPVFRLIRLAEHPSEQSIRDGVIYVVRDGPYAKWAYLRCPCPLGETIRLSLMTSQFPSWTITSDWRGRPNVIPSVRQLDGCRSHFWIRHGRVTWCWDTGLEAERLDRVSQGE